VSADGSHGIKISAYIKTAVFMSLHVLCWNMLVLCQLSFSICMCGTRPKLHQWKLIS